MTGCGGDCGVLVYVSHLAAYPLPHVAPSVDTNCGCAMCSSFLVCILGASDVQQQCLSCRFVCLCPCVRMAGPGIEPRRIRRLQVGCVGRHLHHTCSRVSGQTFWCVPSWFQPLTPECCAGWLAECMQGASLAQPGRGIAVRSQQQLAGLQQAAASGRLATL